MAIIAIYGFSSAVALRLNKGAKVSLRQNSLYDALDVLHGYTSTLGFSWNMRNFSGRAPEKLRRA
jgi:hypothetical protein